MNRRTFWGSLAAPLLLAPLARADVMPTKKILTPNRDWYDLYEEKPADVGQHLAINVNEVFDSYFEAMTNLNKKAALLIHDAAEMFLKEYKSTGIEEIYIFNSIKRFKPGLVIHDIAEENLIGAKSVNYRAVGLERHGYEYVENGKWKDGNKISENCYLRFILSEKTELTKQGKIEYMGEGRWRVDMKLDILNPDVRIEWIGK